MNSADALKSVSFFTKHSLFEGITLKNILTITVAEYRVNCDDAKEIDLKIIKKIESKSVATYSTV